MKKKSLLIIPTIFLMLILFNSVKAQTVSYNITDVLGDSYVQKSAPTSVLGGLSYWLVSEDSTHSTRAYLSFNISSIPLNVTIVQAQMCASVTVDQSSQNVSAYHLLINDWSEGALNWNNQPCGTNFTNTTNCNLTIQDTTQVNGYGWFCWNVTKCVTRAYNDSDINASWVLKTPENSSVLWDSFSSKEGSNTPYLEITYLPIETNLTLFFEDYFAIGENNLVQANYTLYSDSSPIINATCNFNSSEGNATMTYNNVTELYEIYVIPLEVGIVTFNVTCTKSPYEPQYETKDYIAGVFAGNPYNISIYLWENRNATTPYLDEFANILIEALDYNCTPITSYQSCWRMDEYNNGVAHINETIAIGNFSIWYYSGEIYQSCEICPPNLETFNDLMFLGNFIFNENRTRLDLWVNPAELNFWSELKGFALTYGIMVLGLIIAIASAVFIYWFTGKSMLSFIIFILVLLSLILLGVLPGSLNPLRLIL